MLAEPAVEIEDLSFAWRGGNPLLRVRRFAVERAESVFVHGASGSGKSTLLAIIGGVLSAKAGSVRVLGRRLESLSASQRDSLRADSVGFVFQMFNLLPYLSLLDNVTLPCRFSRRRAEAATAGSGDVPAEARRLLGRLGLEDERQLSRSVNELSIGQQQRVAAARALIGRPELIIADEPTSALDADLRDRFVELLLQEAAVAGAAVIFVSHDRALAKHFDRHVALGDING